MRADSLNIPVVDSLIKQKLIELALKNPVIDQSDAMIGSANYEVKDANTAWLNTIVVSGNINEFVVNNTTINGISAANLYPKYNLGINVPLGLFIRQNKNIAREKVKLYEAQKESQKRLITKEVLIAYETYKEKKELLELQKQITDGQQSTYRQKQTDYAAGEVKDIKDVNKEYELWIQERSNQRTAEKELMIAELELESIIGVKLSEVFNSIELNR
jgi:outer membrane protein TolC